MASAETSAKYGAARGAAEVAGVTHVPPFARVLIELLAKRWNGTLLIRADDGEHEAAVRFADGFAVAAKVEAPSATLLQCLIPLCVWVHKRFEFLDREDGIGSEGNVVTGQVDPLGLIAAAVRGPIRDEVLDEALTALGDEPFRLRPTTVLARYGFTAQELHAVACLQRGPIDIAKLRERAQVPEHALRRVIYVLWVTHALSLMATPRRVISGTIRHAGPPPLPGSRSGQELSPLELPPLPNIISDELSGVTVEIANVDEQVRASTVPPTRAPLRSDVAPSPRGRYHVQNPNNGVNAVDARVRSIPPVIDALLRATNRPRPSSMPAPSRTVSGAAPAPRSGAASQPPRATSPAPHPPTVPARSFTPASMPASTPGDAPVSASPLPASEPPSARASASPTPSVPEAANPTRSLKPVRQSPLTRSLKPVRPSAPPPTHVAEPDPGKPTRSLKPVTSSMPPASRSSAPPQRSSASPQRSSRPSSPGQSLSPNRNEGDARFALAEGLMRRADYTAAVTEMQEAMKLRGPRAADEALFGWLLYQERGAPAEVPEAAWQAIERAFRLDLHSDVAYHYKAMLLKREGRLAEARAHFRRALHLNPRNVEARRELRVLLMRKRDGTNSKQPSGLLNRIFGRTPPPR